MLLGASARDWLEDDEVTTLLMSNVGAVPAGYQLMHPFELGISPYLVDQP